MNELVAKELPQISLGAVVSAHGRVMAVTSDEVILDPEDFNEIQPVAVSAPSKAAKTTTRKRSISSSDEQAPLALSIGRPQTAPGTPRRGPTAGPSAIGGPSAMKKPKNGPTTPMKSIPAPSNSANWAHHDLVKALAFLGAEDYAMVLKKAESARQQWSSM